MTSEYKKQQNLMIAYFMDFPEYAKSDLKYDCSWDWLMAVVEEVESMGYRVEMHKKRCSISMNEDVMVDSGAPTKFEAVYMSVCEFIHWQNNPKK